MDGKERGTAMIDEADDEQQYSSLFMPESVKHEIETSAGELLQDVIFSYFHEPNVCREKCL